MGDIHISAEQKYYKHVFDKYFAGCSYLLPKLWLPNQQWVRTGSEPSARVLPVYKN